LGKKHYAASQTVVAVPSSQSWGTRPQCREFFGGNEGLQTRSDPSRPQVCARICHSARRPESSYRFLAFIEEAFVGRSLILVVLALTSAAPNATLAKGVPVGVPAALGKQPFDVRQGAVAADKEAEPLAIGLASGHSGESGVNRETWLVTDVGTACGKSDLTL
jgi:hypothetical protein